MSWEGDMRTHSKPRLANWLVLLALAAIMAACSAERITRVTQVVRVTRHVRVTQVVQVTQVVPVTSMVEASPVEVTRIVLVAPVQAVTQVVEAPPKEVTVVVVVTQIVEIPVTITPVEAVPVATSPTPYIYLPMLDTARLFFSVGDALYRMTLDGAALERVATGLRLSEFMAIDPVMKRVYINRWEQAGQILSFDLYSGLLGVFRDGPGFGVQGMAVDPDESKIYLGLYYSGIFVAGLNVGDYWIQLVDSASLEPLHGQRGQLQIDPARRHIYFRTAYNSSCDACRIIYRVDFDGGNLTKIIPANGGDALALDLTRQKMFYSDLAGNSTVMRANLDGTGAEAVLLVPPPYNYVRSIVLDEAGQKMYLSLLDEANGYRGRAIARANLDGSGFEILSTFVGDTPQSVGGDLAIYFP